MNPVLDANSLNGVMLHIFDTIHISSIVIIVNRTMVSEVIEENKPLDVALKK